MNTKIVYEYMLCVLTIIIGEKTMIIEIQNLMNVLNYNPTYKRIS